MSEHKFLEDNPSVYRDFNRLTSRHDQLDKEAAHGSRHPFETYKKRLTELAQLVDRPLQQAAMEELRATIKAQPRNVEGTTGLPDGTSPLLDPHPATAQYWQTFREESAYRPLERVMESSEARRKFALGKSGGRPEERFDYDFYKDRHVLANAAKALESVDPKLLNGPIIVDSLGNSVEFSKSNRYKSLRKAFAELGLDEDSPAWKLTLLSSIELTTQKWMLNRVKDRCDQYAGTGTYKGNNPTYGGTPETIFQSLLVGRPTDRYTQSRSINFPTSERVSINGTEYYAGLLELIQDNLFTLARTTYPPTEDDPDRPYKALFALKGVLFMRTSQQNKKTISSSLWKQVLIPIAQGDIEGALGQIRHIILDVNPDLYNEVTWEDPLLNLGMTKEQVREHWEKKKKHRCFKPQSYNYLEETYSLVNFIDLLQFT